MVGQKETSYLLNHHGLCLSILNIGIDVAVVQARQIVAVVQARQIVNQTLPQNPEYHELVPDFPQHICE